MAGIGVEVPVIRWEDHSTAGNDIVVYKYPLEDFPYTSQLNVAHSQVALFVNEGQTIPFLPGHYTLSESSNTPLKRLQRWRTIASNGVSAFHCQVYFVNMVYYQDLKFGTVNPIQMVDPEEEINVHVRAAGLFGAHINNDDHDGVSVMKFFDKVVGVRQAMTKNELADYLRGKIVERVTDLLGKTIVEKNIGILKISPKIAELSDALKEQMTPFFDDFGICIDNFSFVSINVPDEDLSALNEAKIAAKKMDIESASMARKRAREGYTYQQERGFDVLGQAASNEGNSGGFMGAGMGLGMGIGVGGAFGGAMGNMAQNAFGSMNQPPQQGYGQPGYPPQQGYGMPQPGYGMPQQGYGQPQQAPAQKCPSCGADVPAGMKFCPNCGNKMAASCPSCGADIAPGAKFCPNCGQKLGGAAHCPSCGAEVEAGAKFCPSCGNKLN